MGQIRHGSATTTEAIRRTRYGNDDEVEDEDDFAALPNDRPGLNFGDDDY